MFPQVQNIGSRIAGRMLPVLEKMGIPMDSRLTVPEALGFVTVPALIGKGIDTARTQFAVMTGEQQKGIEAYEKEKERQAALIRAEARKMVANASVSLPGSNRSIPVSIPFQSDPYSQLPY